MRRFNGWQFRYAGGTPSSPEINQHYFTLQCVTANHLSCLVGLYAESSQRLAYLADLIKMGFNSREQPFFFVQNHIKFHKIHERHCLLLFVATGKCVCQFTCIHFRAIRVILLQSSEQWQRFFRTGTKKISCRLPYPRNPFELCLRELFKKGCISVRSGDVAMHAPDGISTKIQYLLALRSFWVLC